MNYLIDIGHPAHIHYFKNLGQILTSRGNKVIYTAKDSPAITSLLKSLGLEYYLLPAKSDNLIGKAMLQLKYDKIVYDIARKHNIDYAMGVSITIAHLSKISKIKSFVFDDDDDDVQPLFARWGHQYATELISPDVLIGKQKREDVVYFPGYHELAYLHPNHFSPDEKVLSEIGLKKSDTFFIIRFNAFKAHHDTGVTGLSQEQKRHLVNYLSQKGKVIITAEREIDKEFEIYRINISPEKIHHLIYYSAMFIGDSQTMTSEAAVLGTPSIRCNSLVGRIAYLEEEEHKYDLTYGFKPDQFDSLLNKVQELLENPNLKNEWRAKRDKMLEDKIDVTAFWLWFIENYPQSKKEYLRNPDLVNQFK